MRLNKEQLAELVDLCKPVKEFIEKHGNPHNTVFITTGGVTVVEDVAFSSHDHKSRIQKLPE